MRSAWLVLLVLGVATAQAAPKPKTKPAGATAELAKFATEMATAFDAVFAQVAVAKQHEAAGELAAAAAAWRSVYAGAKALTQHARQAAAAGAFQDPMTFATKAGKLTPASFLANANKLQATGDLEWAKAMTRDADAKAKQARVTFAIAIGKQATSLDAIAERATKASSREPEAAHTALENVARGAASLRASIASAVQRKYATATTTYPVQPKPLTASELAVHLTLLEKTARAELAKVDKTLAARPKPAKPAASAHAKPATAGGSRPATEPATAEAPGEPEGQTCSPAGYECSETAPPCCEGAQCLPSAWLTTGHVEGDGYPTVEPAGYECQDPDLAPKR